MKNPRSFVVYWVLNSAFFYFLPLLLVGFIATGNARLTPFLASIISGFLLAVTHAFTPSAVEWLQIKLKEEWQWALAFLAANLLTIWVIARYADLTGVGIANIWAVVFVASLITVAQWVLWQNIDRKKK